MLNWTLNDKPNRFKLYSVNVYCKFNWSMFSNKFFNKSPTFCSEIVQCKFSKTMPKSCCGFVNKTCVPFMPDVKILSVSRTHSLFTNPQWSFCIVLLEIIFSGNKNIVSEMAWAVARSNLEFSSSNRQTIQIRCRVSSGKDPAAIFYSLAFAGKVD